MIKEITVTSYPHLSIRLYGLEEIFYSIIRTIPEQHLSLGSPMKSDHFFLHFFCFTLHSVLSSIRRTSLCTTECVSRSEMN